MVLREGTTTAMKRTTKLIKFWIVKDNFQRKLKDYIVNIKSSTDVYAFADKTTNIYKLLPQDYK